MTVRWKESLLRAKGIKSIQSLSLLLVVLYAMAITAAAAVFHRPWDALELLYRKAHVYVGLILVTLVFLRVLTVFGKKVGRGARTAFGILFAAVLLGSVSILRIPVPITLPAVTVIYFGFFLWIAFVLLTRRNWDRKASIQGLGLLLLLFPVVGIGPALRFSSSLIINLPHHLHHGAAVLFVPLLLWHLHTVVPQRVVGIRKNLIRLLPALLLLLVVTIVGILQNRRLGVKPVAEGQTPDFRQELFDLTTCDTAGCHADIMGDWRISTHRFAGTNRAYDEILDRFENTFGESELVFCERCHNPMLAEIGIKDRHDPETKRLRDQGVNCAGCHLAEDVDVEIGNGLVVYRRPRKLFNGMDLSNPEKVRVTRELIRYSLNHHRNDWRLGMKGSSEKCGVCHKVTMPEKYTEGKKLVLGDTYTPWVASEAARLHIGCVDCHMQFTPDPYQPDWGRFDHKTLGFNQALSILVHAHSLKGDLKAGLTDLEKHTRDFIAGKIAPPPKEVATFYRLPTLAGMKRALDFLTTPPILIRIEAGGNLTPGGSMYLSVISTNDTGAHHIPTGLLDIVKVWLKLEVEDAGGRSVFRSGFLDEEGILDPDARKLGAVLFDAAGNVIDDHRFWKIASVRVRSIKLGEELEDRFEIPLPDDVQFPIMATVSWNYRRYNVDIAEELFGANTRFPTLTLVEAHWRSGESD